MSSNLSTGYWMDIFPPKFVVWLKRPKTNEIEAEDR